MKRLSSEWRNHSQREPHAFVPVSRFDRDGNDVSFLWRKCHPDGIWSEFNLIGKGCLTPRLTCDMMRFNNLPAIRPVGQRGRFHLLRCKWALSVILMFAVSSCGSNCCLVPTGFKYLIKPKQLQIFSFFWSFLFWHRKCYCTCSFIKRSR